VEACPWFFWLEPASSSSGPISDAVAGFVITYVLTRDAKVGWVSVHCNEIFPDFESRFGQFDFWKGIEEIRLGPRTPLVFWQGKTLDLVKWDFGRVGQTECLSQWDRFGTGTWYRHAACTKPVPEKGQKRPFPCPMDRSYTHAGGCACPRDRLYTHAGGLSLSRDALYPRWSLSQSNLSQPVLLHQEITRVILCRLILNDIIIHIKFLNDMIMFSKIVRHFYVTNFENYVVLFLIRHNNELLMLFICHRIFEQHNNITMCDYIISLNKFNNITHSMIFSL